MSRLERVTGALRAVRPLGVEQRGPRDYYAPALSALRSAAERDENNAVRRFVAQAVSNLEVV